MIKRLGKYKLVWLAPLVSIAVLSVIIAFLPVAFSACRVDSIFCRMWYILSQSADIYGTGIIAIIMGFVLAFIIPGFRHKSRVILLNFVLLCSCLGLLAAGNEYIIKPLTHIPRPSHEYLSDHSTDSTFLKDLYSKKGEAKNNFIANQIKINLAKLKTIPDLVLKAWTSEAGYSFPSGHSQNAFLLGTLICYLLTEVLPKNKKKFAVLIFIWSIMVGLSRIALGVHSMRDVIAGAATGTLLAFVLIGIGIYEKFYFEKLENEKAVELEGEQST